MKDNQKKLCLKESYELFHIWLMFAAVILGAYTLNPVKISGLDTAESYTILTIIMIILLHILITITGSVYWLPGVSYEAAAKAGKKRCRICGVKNVLIFIVAVVLYLCYCHHASQAIVSSSIHSAIAGAAIIGAAVVLSGKNN